MTTVVDHLKKVTLELQWGARRAPFEFILGAASDGLCPFEAELLHRTVGDRLQLSIPKAMTEHTFGHLHPDLRAALRLNDPFETLDLSVTVAAVVEPPPREVVRAMAQATDRSGCGGSCGCGCGGH